MKALRANISGIIKSSAIDGPGNRMVIFFQSCQFNCMYCHNSHTIGLCDLCGHCMEICPSQSLSINKEQERIDVNASTCIKCDRCIRECPQSSSPFYQQYTGEELITELLQVRDFISGLTVSGGEVMLQAEFLKSFFEGIRQHPELKDLSILVDSNGCFEQAQWEPLLDLVDGFMIDVKAISPAVHERITGRDNKKVLESIAYLDSRNKLHEVRMVVVPNYNDTQQEVESFARLLQSLSPNVSKVLIKMRKHGLREKYSFLQSPTDEDMQSIWQQIGDPEVKVV